MSTAKKYAAIAATLGWTEYEPQEDGMFLQPEEATTIDNALANATALQTQLDTANASVTALQAQVAGMHSAESVAALNARITDLEAENKELGKGASGNGTVVETSVEVETTSNNGKPSITDANHPLNKAVAEEVAAKENAKKVKARYGV